VIPDRGRAAQSLGDDPPGSAELFGGQPRSVRKITLRTNVHRSSISRLSHRSRQERRRKVGFYRP